MAEHNYFEILTDLKRKIQQARQRAILAVNSELLYAYWEIGNTILVQQKLEGWGTKVITRLIADLRTEFPEMRGLSPRNFKYMRSFAEAFPDFGFSASTTKGIENQNNIIVQQLVAQLPWSHHLTILAKVKQPLAREFYIKKAVENGWSRNILTHQITSDLHSRQGQIINNFELTLPSEQSDLAKETFKSPYIFDFLHSAENTRELDLEKALIAQIKNFILELGRGFAFIGNQYRIKIEDDEVFIDLLFFHYKLDCFVVFDLKVGEFKPEYAGKLNFYTTVIDEEVKLPHHKPTIGVLLCKSSNQTMVKYSLKNIGSPLGVSTFELVKDLPTELKTVMPTIEELEEEIDKEVKMHKQLLIS